MAIACWVTDPETKEHRAYQFKGDVRFETSGRLFEEGYRWVKSIKPEAQPKAAVVVKVDTIFNLQPHG